MFPRNNKLIFNMKVDKNRLRPRISELIHNRGHLNRIMPFLPTKQLTVPVCPRAPTVKASCQYNPELQINKYFHLFELLNWKS